MDIDIIFASKASKDAVRAVLDSADAVAAIASTDRAVTPKDWSTVADNIKPHFSPATTSLPKATHSRAMVALCARMIASGSKKAMEQALELLEVRIAPTAGGAAAVVPLLRSDPKWTLLDKIHRVFRRHPDAVEHIEVLREFEHSPDWRAAAAARLTLHGLGQTVSPYRYEGFCVPFQLRVEPGYEQVIEQVARLGGSVKVATRATGHLSYSSSARKQSWSGTDPLGTIAVPSGVLWNAYEGLDFDAKAFTYAPKGQEKRELSFVKVSENFDIEVDGHRRLLAPIAYCESTQYFYCFDLSGAKSKHGQLSIWSIDHDGTGPSEKSRLVDFLKALRPAKKR